MPGRHDGDAATPPTPLGKAVLMLRKLQELLEKVVDGQCGVVPGINEGYYLRLCQLTGGIHEQLDAVKVEGAPKRRTGFAFDDDDLLSGTWTVRRVRRLRGGDTIVVDERGPLPPPLVA